MRAPQHNTSEEAQEGQEQSRRGANSSQNARSRSWRDGRRSAERTGSQSNETRDRTRAGLTGRRITERDSAWGQETRDRIRGPSRERRREEDLLEHEEFTFPGGKNDSGIWERNRQRAEARHAVEQWQSATSNPEWRRQQQEDWLCPECHDWQSVWNKSCLTCDAWRRLQWEQYNRATGDMHSTGYDQYFGPW